MSAVAVKDAFLARLRAGDTLGSIVHEGTVASRPSRYVSVFTSTGRRRAERFTGRQTVTTQLVVTHSVGETPDKAMRLAELVADQVVDAVLAVPGRSCRPIRHGESQPPELDADGRPELWYCVDEFTIISEPV